MWWLPPGFPFPFPKATWHFIEVPAPSTAITSLEITLEDELKSIFNASSWWQNKQLDLRVFITNVFTSVKIRGVENKRLGFSEGTFGTFELIDVPFGGQASTDEVTTYTTLTITVDDPAIIEYINSAEDTIILKVRSFSSYNLDFTHPIFIHKLDTISQIFGTITYH